MTSRTVHTRHSQRRSSPLSGPRVAVSGWSLRFPDNGTGRYAAHVLGALCKAPDLVTTVITDARAIRYDLPASAHVVPAPRLPLRLGNNGQKLYWEQVGYRLAARHLAADVLYAPHFSMPLYAHCPTVISVHDVIPLTEPGYAGSLPTRIYFKLVSAAARQASAVVTLSHYARSEIERLLHIPQKRIHVVPPGVDLSFSPISDAALRVHVRERYGLPGRYMLYVGGADARKNLSVLLKAVAAIPYAHNLPPLVIVAGDPKPGQEALFPDWRGQARALHLGPRVIFVKRVEEEDLAEVYRGAVALCFPSRAEGFGLTPVEAMACGTPAICAAATSLPEAVGDAGLLVPPDDVGGWAHAMTRIAHDDELRAQLAGRGLARAAQFRWELTGARVLEIIRSVTPCAS